MEYSSIIQALNSLPRKAAISGIAYVNLWFRSTNAARFIWNLSEPRIYLNLETSLKC